MKNILIVATLVVIAFLAYNFFNKGNGENQGSLDTPASSKSSTEASSLISRAPEGAAVFILEPGDGATVSSPLTIRFGITNMQVAAAGQDLENSGHHHLLLDLAELPDLSQPLPATDQIIHFGKGQTETTIDLSAGQHSLQLLLGNYLHIPHDPAVISKKITITVE